MAVENRAAPPVSGGLAVAMIEVFSNDQELLSAGALTPTRPAPFRPSNRCSYLPSYYGGHVEDTQNMVHAAPVSPRRDPSQSAENATSRRTNRRVCVAFAFIVSILVCLAILTALVEMAKHNSKVAGPTAATSSISTFETAPATVLSSSTRTSETTSWSSSISTYQSTPSTVLSRLPHGPEATTTLSSISTSESATTSMMNSLTQGPTTSTFSLDIGSVIQLSTWSITMETM